MDLHNKLPGRVAAIDYGTVRIGIAISDAERRFASPHENYTRRNVEQDAARFVRLVTEESIELFVVGLPIHLDGGESQKSREAREFAKWLGAVTGVEVVLFDERFTSAQAEQMLGDANLTKKKTQSAAGYAGCPDSPFGFSRGWLSRRRG